MNNSTLCLDYLRQPELGLPAVKLLRSARLGEDYAARKVRQLPHVYDIRGPDRAYRIAAGTFKPANARFGIRVRGNRRRSCSSTHSSIRSFHADRFGIL